MKKRYDQSLDYIIRSEDDKVFAEPYGNDGLWLSLQARRDSEIKSLGVAMPIEQAIQLRDALNEIIAGLALPQFCVEGYVVNRNVGEFFTMDVHAKDESAAIDCVLNQTFDNLRSLRCGSTEVVL